MIILLPCAAIVGMWALGKGSLFGGKMKMSKNVDGVKVQNQEIWLFTMDINISIIKI